MNDPRMTPSPSWYEPREERDLEAEENDLLCKGDEIMERDQDR